MKWILAVVFFGCWLLCAVVEIMPLGHLMPISHSATKDQRLQFKPGDLKLYADPNVITLTSDDKWDCHKLDPAGHAVFCKSGTSRIIWWEEPK